MYSGTLFIVALVPALVAPGFFIAMSQDHFADIGKMGTA